VHHIVLEDCIAAVEAATSPRDQLEAHIEAAVPDWSLARISREQLLRQEPLAKPVRDIEWKPQERLCRRHHRLARAGKLPTVITAPIAFQHLRSRRRQRIRNDRDNTIIRAH
jgi:hypothetical protein